MKHTYQKIYISGTDYKIRQIRDDDKIRFVDEDHHGYQGWITAGNTPVVIPFVPPPEPSVDYIRNSMLVSLDNDFKNFIDLVRSAEVLFICGQDNAEINEIRENYILWFHTVAEYKAKKAKEIKQSDSPDEVEWFFDDYDDRNLFDYENILTHIRN